LYLQGELAGELSPRLQTFTWDASQGAILLGLGYVGLLDELAIWDRALSDDAIREVKRAGEPPSR
jgi:hypothetical protein